MPTFAVVVNGSIVWEGEADNALTLSEKVRLNCKRLGHAMVWADHGQVVQFKLDPSWVVLRNGGRKRKVVLARISEAPQGWLAELSQLYGWKP